MIILLGMALVGVGFLIGAFAIANIEYDDLDDDEMFTPYQAAGSTIGFLLMGAGILMAAVGVVSVLLEAIWQ